MSNAKNWLRKHEIWLHRIPWGISIQGTGSTWGNENFEIPEKTVNKSYLIDKLDILYTNADGLINKRQELRVLINSLQDEPDVIAITEIKPKNMSDTIQPSEFNLDGYNVFLPET